MNQPRLNRPPWTCECGRKVPAHIEACRCGKTRPEDVGAPGAADWAEQQEAALASANAEKPGLFSSKSLIQVGGVILVMGLFFGSRYFNRYRTSREARSVIIEGLSKEFGKEVATGLVDKVHWPCFEPNYHMSFRRRGGTSTFDEEEYLTCAVKGIEREVGRAGIARSKAKSEEAREAREASLEASLEAKREASREANTVRTESSREAEEAIDANTMTYAEAKPSSEPVMLGISDLRVLNFDRSTSTFNAEFSVVGSVTQKFVCRYSLTCGANRRILGEGFVPCIKPRDAVRADGELRVTRSMSAPEGLCSLSVDLTDGRRGGSNRLTTLIP